MKSQLSKLASVPAPRSPPRNPPPLLILQTHAHSQEGRSMPQVYLGKTEKGAIFLMVVDIQLKMLQIR